MENILPYFEWLVIAAAFIAAIGNAIAFKGLINQARVENFENLEKIQTKFFIRIALIESIPIVFIIMAFIAIETYPYQNPLVGVVISIFILLLGAIIVLAELFNMDRSNKTEVTNTLTLTFIGLALVEAIPIVSIVFFLIGL